MPLSDNFLRDYLLELYTTDTLKERFHVYDKYLKRLGFETAVYSVMPRIQFESVYNTEPVFISSDEFSKDFLDHYSNKELSKHDFTIRRISNNLLDPMDWQKYEMNGLVNADEQRLIQLAREDYGIINAISVPTMNEKAGFSGASIVSSEKNASFQKLMKENQEALIFFTRQFHQRNLQGIKIPAKFVEGFLTHFSPNEIGIICHLAEGKPFKTVVDVIELSEPKGAYQALDYMRHKKFNGISKEKLMYLFGLLDFTQYLETP